MDGNCRAKALSRKGMAAAQVRAELTSTAPLPFPLSF
jgi:hypothetical protein